MTYLIGNVVVASDFMTLRGDNGPDTAYANDTAATNKAAALIGVGYGTRGYGQTATALGNAIVDSNVTVTEWNQLRSVMSTINSHTNSGLTLQPVVSSGNVILAQDGSAGRTNITTLLATLDYNRLNVNPTEMSLSTVLTSNRTTSWTTSVYHEFTATFASEDDARYFFNSGGEIRTSGTRTGGGAGAMNKNITAMLSQMGSVKFGATTTTNTGTGGTGTLIGYYGLSSSYQQLFQHLGAGGIYTYTNISYTLQARRESYVGLNGANGALIRFQATFSLGGYVGVNADGILASIVSSYRSTGLVSVTAPTYVTVIGIGP